MIPAFKTNIVEVKQMEAKTLEKLLRFVYTDQVNTLNKRSSFLLKCGNCTKKIKSKMEVPPIQEI